MYCPINWLATGVVSFPLLDLSLNDTKPEKISSPKHFTKSKVPYQIIYLPSLFTPVYKTRHIIEMVFR